MLFDAIPKRRTNRSPFSPEPIEPSVKTEWLQDAANFDCWLDMTEDEDERHEIANLIAYLPTGILLATRTKPLVKGFGWGVLVSAILLEVIDAVFYLRLSN